MCNGLVVIKVDETDSCSPPPPRALCRTDLVLMPEVSVDHDGALLERAH
jgi:hypothetical protein